MAGRGTATHDPGYSPRAVEQSVVRTLGVDVNGADEVRLADVLELDLVDVGLDHDQAS